MDSGASRAARVCVPAADCWVRLEMRFQRECNFGGAAGGFLW